MTDSANVTIEFFDDEAENAGCVIVRRCGDKIALCISRRSNGDVEAFLDRSSAERLVRAIEESLGGDAAM